jgi:hypothetical protein
VARLGWDQVIAWRTARHHLDERVPATAMLEVVSGLCGLHAQIMSSAELSLWARVEGLEPGAVQRSLWEERSLVKTWAMRGTLHLLPSAAFPLWQAARSTTGLWETGAWQRGFGVTLGEPGRRCSSRPPPSGSSASLPAEASRSVSPAPTPGWAAGPATTPSRPWTR